MILQFRISNNYIFYGVSKDRVLSIAAPATNMIFKVIDELKSLKTFSRDQLKALDDTKKIISGLKSDVEVKKYIISEMNKLGGVYIRELSVEEYLDQFKNGFSK